MGGFSEEITRILNSYKQRGMTNTATKNNPALDKLIKDAMEETGLSQKQVKVNCVLGYSFIL